MPANGNAPAFDAWMDDFLAAYYRRRPVNATFIGVHDHDAALPDFSENGIADTLAEMKALLKRSESLPVEPLSVAQTLDKTLATGYLLIQLWELELDHFQRANPVLYTSEAVFSVISLFLTDFAPVGERVQNAIARMAGIPSLLDQARRNVPAAPAAWIEKAIDECIGAGTFFTQGIDLLGREHGVADPAFRHMASQAAAAFEEYRRHLAELLGAGSDHYACGEDAFTLLMHEGHFIYPDLDDLVRYAEGEIDAATAFLEEHARHFGARSAAEALGQLSAHHPTAHAYYGRFREVWEAAQAAGFAHGLVTWPDFPIEYVPQPAWARGAAPHLYFLNYRAPAAFNRPPVHRYLVPPVEPEMPPEQQEKLLRATNDAVIKTNHVVHHGGIGHHVQNWNAYHAESRIGQIAAVDTASRIAMFCGGTMAEGWAVYATGLMDEVGFLTPLESYAERHSRRRMAARTVVDVKLHRGEFSLDEAAEFYEARGGMGHEMARKEAVKNSMFPGAAMMYLYGSDRIRSLREQVSRMQGSEFDLKRFHDRFLGFGSIPVELVAAEMLAEVPSVK